MTSTAVMEHVENDRVGFQEIFRVLKPNGNYIFTVPFSVERQKTLIRAKRNRKGAISHYHTPEYHGDPFRGDGGVFTWRNYGLDILQLLSEIGFVASVREVSLDELDKPMPVIVAHKPPTKPSKK